MINDLNLTHSIALKMSHPLLAKMHDVLLKIKNAFKETPYKEKTNGIIRTIEMAYVKTANGKFESVESEESNGERLSAKQKRALETVTIADESTNNATAISSADGAKVQNNLEILADNYEKRPNKTRGFITDLSQALNLEQHEASHYGTFETRNGNLVTIRVSNHNARVSFFDENGEENGISIVISSHKNKGVLNDGKAHLVEYFYPKQSIERSESKPLADIVKCVSNALDSGKFDDTTGIAQRQEVNMPNSDENVLYSLRQKPEPEKKGTGYKVFVLGKDGKLYPPMVANPNGAATPVGVWLDADAAPVAGESKTGRPQVKQGGKGTQGGSGKLAYRPGWHLGVIPYAIQFNRKDAEGNKTLFPKNFVFAEVEYAADKDYQDEAHAEGINSNGKYQHSLAGLKHLPTDGYYMYRTNPNPETDPWVITGAMKVNRLLTRAEQADIVRKAGREPQQIQEGDIVTDDVVNSINQEIAAAPKFSLKVYHGSGADFTEFDFDHMGEGAGTQAFGWGGYVTSSKKIGKSYATLMDNDPSKAYYRIQRSNGTRFAKKYPTLESFLHGDKQIAMNDKFTEQEKIDYYNEMKKLAEPYHNLYEVDIPDDNGSNYLEWEKKPSNEVATKIIEGIYGLDDKTLDDMAARDIVFRTLMYDYIKNADKEQMIPILVKTNGLTRNTVYDNGNVEDDMRFVYNRLSNWMGSPKAASKFLSSLGFTGIKYPAGTIYGGAEEGDVNYVIFKPEDMQIVEHEKFSVKEGINRGYTQRENGDKISKNAYEAEEDGTYSHGTFKRKYKVAARTFPLLQQLGFITNTEWHHTGRNFSKTGFYTWADSDRISGGSISYADGKTQSGSIAAKYKENKQEIDDIVKGLPSKQWEFTKPESTETLSYEAWLSRKIPFREEDYLSKEEQAEKQANHERISADKSTPSYYRGESHKAVDQLYYNVAREHYQKELEDNRQQHEAEYKQYESEFPSKMQKLKEQNLGTNGKEKDLMRIYDLLGYKDSYGQVIKEISRPLATEDIDRVIGDGEKFSVKSKPVRFEIGKKLSDEEKKEVLSTLKDAYKVNGVPYHIEETAGGKEKRVYEPTFDSYVVSDITNRPLRYYITLPDGRVAHPTEIYPNISDNEVKSSATKQGLLDDEADQIVSAAIGNMKGIADNAKAVEVLTELQNLPHETHDIGYGLNNAQSYNYKTGIFTSDAAQAIDYVVRRMRRKEDVPAEIPAALKKAVADSYGMVDNLIDGMSNTKVGATEIKPVGVGAFGNIYNQFRGKAKAAIEFLKKLGNGEAAAALHHHTIGDISLVWGDKKTGLDKILRKHPEVIDNLQSIIDSMEVVLESDNRIKLESPTHFAVVSKEYKGEPREQWLLTAYEKRESLENGKSMDTATSSLGGDTALSQSKESAANIANPSETSKGNAGKFSLRLQDAINETDTEPTEAQKKSGNYKKGHVKFGGYDYTIENPKGSYRSGVDENGKEWKQKMNDTYGYIRGKFGKDGDHLDMFINDKADLDSWNGDVFVVDQVNQDGTFDEHKVMYGYGSLDEAKKAYLSNYEKGWTGLGNITPVSKADFDKWLDKSNRKLKPFADYADITSKTNMDTAPSSFEEFLEHPAVRYSIRNEKERAAAEDAYNFAQENRPDRYSRYAIVNMEKPGAVPQYLEKKAVADNWRRYYNKLKWGNYKLFDLDKPFEDNVKNLVGKFPETFRKKNDTTLSKINELTADYNKRKEEYDAMSNSIQELLNGLMKQGRSLTEAESVIRDWGLYKEMDSKYQNLMGIRKQLNELRSGKVADDERFSLIGKKGAEALDHAEEVSTRLDNLNVARQMEEAKKDAKAIKMTTGWERGADGRWRYEIPDFRFNYDKWQDSNSTILKKMDAKDRRALDRYRSEFYDDLSPIKKWNFKSLMDKYGYKVEENLTLGDVLDGKGMDALFKAYPELKAVRFRFETMPADTKGGYNADTNIISINRSLQFQPDNVRSTIAHEVQHAIQHIEGFAQGGDSKHIRKVLERMINENQEASDYAKDKLKEWVTLTMAADRLSDLYKQYINSDNEWLKNKAIESYWDAMNELDNNEQSTLTNDYPDGTAREIAESGYHVDEAEKELRRLAKETKESIPEGNNSALDLVSKLTDALENNDDYNLYRKLGGEVEARNVQSRMGMSPEERRKTLAEETEDVARKDQIFLYGGSVSMMGSRAFNEAINSSDNIRFSLKSMMEKPEGWKQANKKAIHIAEAIERDPKFSLKNLDGTLIKAGTYFSGGGLVEEGLKGIIDPVVAVEYDEKISGVYRNNFGNHIVTADVRDVDPKELVGKIDGEVEYFHASPVCKNYSLAKNNHEELELDKETAASTAEFISKVRPKVVTIENVKGYKDSEAMKTITDALDEAGYKWDADVYNAADYGGYTNRERLIVRAVRDGELPAKPEKQKRKSGWYEAVEDIMPTLTEKKNGVAPWMDERLKADGIDWRHIDKPLYVMGSGYANGTVPHAFADELLPTLRTKSGDVIVMPDGKVYRAMGRVLARVSGVSDDYQMPASEALSHTIIGNGIPTQLTENVIAPLVRDVLHPEVEEKASLKDADRKQTQLDIILKTNPMLDDYHTGIRKVEDIKTLGESVEEARSEAEKYGDDEWSAYPDITNDMLQNALETGEITIYSSKPIKNGVFVTPSYMQASDYAGGGNVYEKTVPLTDVAWINTDEGQYAKVDGERYSLKEVNDKFNDRLAQLIENPNQKDRVLHLGRSSQFLIDGGIADAEIELDFDKFVRKSSEKYKNNHPFSAGDIKDLPKAIAHPVAVFNSTTKKDHVVMTELNHDGKNFIVAIRATEQNRKNKVVLEVNQITSLYPKGERGIIYWINNNKLSNVDKEKALHFIEALQPHAGTLTSEELSSAANIVRNFVNPKQNDGNLQKTERYSLRVDRYRDELNQWKKDNNLPKDAERPQLPVREPNDRLGFT